MARIRTIKPAFWEAVSPLSHEARLLTIGLISLADDEGRWINTHSSVAGYIYPQEDIQPARLQRWMGEITHLHGRDGTPMIELYTIGARRFGWFPRYRLHQKINRPQPSTLPPPPEAHLFSESSIAKPMRHH